MRLGSGGQGEMALAASRASRLLLLNLSWLRRFRSRCLARYSASRSFIVSNTLRHPLIESRRGSGCSRLRLLLGQPDTLLLAQRQALLGQSLLIPLGLERLDARQGDSEALVFDDRALADVGFLSNTE